MQRSRHITVLGGLVGVFSNGIFEEGKQCVILCVCVCVCVFVSQGEGLLSLSAGSLGRGSAEREGPTIHFK